MDTKQETSENIAKDESTVEEVVLEPFTKPVHKSILGTRAKTAFKGARNCPSCGKPSMMRLKESSQCLSCGHEE